MRLRQALPTDARAVWEIANAAEVRAASFHPDPIPWDEHRTWFAEVLADPGRDLLVATENDVVVAYVRFDVSGGRSIISLAVRPDRHGGGVGRRLLSAAISTHRRRPVVAYVKPDNHASLRLFRPWRLEAAGDPHVFVLDEPNVDGLR